MSVEGQMKFSHRTGPVAAAGLSRGDVIVAIEQLGHISDALTDRFEPGETVDIMFARGVGAQVARVTLGEKPAPYGGPRPDPRRRQPAPETCAWASSPASAAGHTASARWLASGWPQARQTSATVRPRSAAVASSGSPASPQPASPPASAYAR
jgi:hypothetical protein